jgi:hypothetical protein
VYRPEASLTTVFLSPVSEERAVMVALGTMAPFGSVTMPASVAVGVWAKAASEANNKVVQARNCLIE